MARIVKWPKPIEAAKGEAAAGTVFAIGGLTCPDCAAQFEQSVRGLDGVKSAHLNFGAGKLVVRGLIHPREVIRHAQRAGYHAAVVDALGKHPGGPWTRDVGRIWFLALAALFFAGGLAARFTELTWPPLLLGLLPPAFTLEKALFAASIFYGGYHMTRGALHGLRHRSLDAGLSATVVALGALIIGKWLEAALVTTLFSLRELALARGLEEMRSYVRMTWERIPGDATRLSDGQEETVPTADLVPGDTCIVGAGGQVPADGLLVKGASIFTETPLCGAEIPVSMSEGDAVYAGSTSSEGPIHVRVERPAEESALGRALRLIEDAQATTLPTLEWGAKVAAIVSPVIVVAAIITAVGPPLLFGRAVAPWLEAGLSLLIIALPCALAASSPAVMIPTFAALAKLGVFVKSADALERLARINLVAFEKSAAFTRSRLKVTDIYPLDGWSKHEVLAMSAGIAWGLEDPVGKALVRAAIEANTGMVTADASRLSESGSVEAVVDGEAYAVGEVGAMERRGIALTPVLAIVASLEKEGKIVALVARGQAPIAVVALTETAKDESRRALRRLKRMYGIDTVVMLSGEDQRATAAAAAVLKVDEYWAELRPEEKVSEIKRLQRQGRRVALVAGGESDRAALAVADVGIVLGPLGMIDALEKADALIVGDDFGRLPHARTLARRALAISWQSIAGTLLIKVAALSLLALGHLTLWQAALLDFIAAAFVILSGARMSQTIRLPQVREPVRQG